MSAAKISKGIPSHPILPHQQYLIAESILLLERCQKDMLDGVGNSKERSRVCKVLETLHNLDAKAARDIARRQL